jgi:A/G-specific adenine glycosylase
MDLGSALKKTVPNPNRQSIHYTKQSPFEGSDRKIRGAIIRMLLAEPGIRENTLLNIWRDDPARIKKILSALEYEGFILRNNDRFFLSGGPGFS